MKHYNLDAIIAVGYRGNSKRATDISPNPPNSVSSKNLHPQRLFYTDALKMRASHQ
ncbi:virulence RhuM family protein [Treponema primitia]|uniref:hypothetical protein n=1 Tax=Treponema primitia TaxID=88058 RepID=UPI00397F378B